MTERQRTPDSPTDSTQHHSNRSTTMNLLHEDLARAHSRALLASAAERRRGHELALAQRMSRRAERNAMRARLALARML